MMKSLRTFIIIVFSVSLFSSCQKDACVTKNQFLDSYNAFIKEIEDSKEELSASDKEAFETRFQNIVENCYKKYKPELSLKEKQDFWKSSIKYYLAKEGDEINIKISKANDEFEEYVQNEIKEVIEESGTQFFGSLEKIVNENLPKLFEGFSNELEKFAKDLEDILEDKN